MRSTVLVIGAMLALLPPACGFLAHAEEAPANTPAVSPEPAPKTPDAAPAEKSETGTATEPAAAKEESRDGGKDGDKPADNPADKAVDKPVDKAGEKPADKPVDGPGEKPGDKSPDKSAEKGGPRESLCLILESAASANGIPVEFFARLVWQESRFRPDAVGPMTRRGVRAQGIAQFMPYTAEERGLLDPFDPVAALPKAAEFLSELREEFGNLGLAAAAYNAGPRRVRDWLSGIGGLPGETRNYVAVITGRTADDWADLSRTGRKDIVEPKKPVSCATLVALLDTRPSFFLGELERRIREGTLKPWGVQLSAGFSKVRVLSAYARIERRHRALLDGKDPVILRTLLRSRGTRAFYQMRVGADTRVAANRLCADLSRQGGSCMVLRNSRGVPEKP